MNTPPKTFCENPLCENPGMKVVCVSTEEPSDQWRTLCAACEEAFSWGVQHGQMAVTQRRAGGLERIYVDRRQLATILAALRYHRDENLQTTEHIPDTVVREIATDSGRLKPLSYREVEALSARLREGPLGQSDGHGKEQAPEAQKGGQTVEISIDGGNAEVTSKPTGVALKIVDYDVQGSQPE